MTSPEPFASPSPRPLVLVVEDDAPLNRLLAAALEHTGYEVAQAFDGLQAYELARRRPPSVVLLDLDLPKLYGQVVLRALRRDAATAGIAVVVLTGHPKLLREEDRVAASAVLYKPARLEQILAAVAAALQAA